MSDDRALAQAASRIAALEQQLAAEQSAHHAAAAELATAAGQLATVQTALATEQDAHRATVAELATAAGHADELQTALAAEQGAHRTTVAELATARAAAAQLPAAQQQAAQLAGQVAELRAKYEAPPPAGSGILAVTRWQTGDGALHATAAEAALHAAAVGIMQTVPLSPAVAAALVANRRKIAAHLAAADAAPAA